jgi:hypothetical protein
MSLNQAVRIGSDIRWLLGGGDMLKALLRQHLTVADASEVESGACHVATASRQVAIRQAIGDGIEKSFSPADPSLRQREEIRRRLEDITGLSNAQANRILNGVGHFSASGGDIEPDTVELAGRYFDSDKGFAKELSLELIYLLTLAASESSLSFMLRPYQFAANTAAAALRLRVGRIESKTEYDSLQEIRKQFPRLCSGTQWSGVSATTELFPDTRMGLYGLYMWQSGSVFFETAGATVEEESGLLTDAIDRTIRWAPSEAPWIFPELVRKSPADQTAARTSSVYRSVVQRAVLEVASSVGQALLGIHPFTRPLREGTQYGN